MPNLYKTGPLGQGSKTGRQMGDCVKNENSDQTLSNQFLGRGRGGQGRGLGRGQGRGCGRGLGRGFGRGR